MPTLRTPAWQMNSKDDCPGGKAAGSKSMSADCGLWNAR